MSQQGSDDRFDEAEPTAAIQHFEQTLERARKLIEGHDLDAAVAVLHALEKRYLAESRLFDLLGEVLLLQGKIEEGIRYRALYQDLKKTLDAAARESGSARQRDTLMTQPELSQHPIAGSSANLDAQDHRESYRQAPPEPSFAPVTAAMGNELMRQGHFDRALAIFSVLVEKNPGDEKLRKARDQARRKSRDQRTLRTLGSWLEKIERIKTGRSAEA